MEKKQVVMRGEYFCCDLGISTGEWREVLQDSKIITKYRKECLIMLYYEPEHRSTCKALGKKYNTKPSSINGIMLHFAKAVGKKLDRFVVYGVAGGRTYWIIPMTGRYVDRRKLFEWTLRPELVEAIEMEGWVEKSFSS